MRYAVAQLVEALRYKLGSIPGVTIWIFHWCNPSGRTIALGSTQPLTEISTKNIPGGKRRPAHRADNLDTCADCFEIWEPQPPRTLRACPGLCRDYFTFLQYQNLARFKGTRNSKIWPKVTRDIKSKNYRITSHTEEFECLLKRQ